MTKKSLPQKIVIVGAGAIGRLLEMKFSEHYEVIMIGRETRPEEIAHIPEESIVILATKAQDSVAAIEKIKNKLSKHAVIVCVQNGVGSEDSVRSLTLCRVVRAVTYLAAELTASGEIKFMGDGPTYFDKDDGDIADIFGSVG